MVKPMKLKNKAPAAAEARRPVATPPKKKIKKKQKNSDAAGKVVAAAAVAGTESRANAAAPGPASGSTAGPAAPAPAAAPAAVASSSRSEKSKNGKKQASEPAGKSSGFIFMCSGKTKPECYRYRVFGLPKNRIEMVQKIKEGTKLFLYDFDLKLLYGVYKATTQGGLNLVPNAFNGGFPAQVKFKITKDCLPLPESKFIHAIQDNYYKKGLFTPELNSKQVQKLSSLFQPINLQSQQLPPVPEERRAHAPRVEDRHPRRQYVQDRRASPPYVEDRRVPPVRYVEDRRAPLVQYVDDRRAPPPVQYVDDRHHLSRLPPEDSYMSIRAAHFLPPVESRYLYQDPGNDPYARVARAPLVEARRVTQPVASFGDLYYQAPPVDAYQVDSARTYYLDSHISSDRVAYRVVPETIPRDPLLSRDYGTVTAREGGIAPRLERARDIYNSDELIPAQSSYLSSSYEDTTRAYNDRVPLSDASRPGLSSLPVSSRYSFAGATPAYR